MPFLASLTNVNEVSGLLDFVAAGCVRVLEFFGLFWCEVCLMLVHAGRNVRLKRRYGGLVFAVL